MAAVDRSKLALVKAVLIRAWCAETASPTLRESWSLANPSLGQCDVTALVIHEMFGGYIMRAEVEELGSHYYNILPDGSECDLTRGQFPAGTIVPRGVEVPRERLFSRERSRAARTQERYALLISRVADIFSGQEFK